MFKTKFPLTQHPSVQMWHKIRFWFTTALFWTLHYYILGFQYANTFYCAVLFALFKRDLWSNVMQCSRICKLLHKVLRQSSQYLHKANHFHIAIDKASTVEEPNFYKSPRRVCIHFCYDIQVFSQGIWICWYAVFIKIKKPPQIEVDSKGGFHVNEETEFADKGTFWFLLKLKYFRRETESVEWYFIIFCIITKFMVQLK